MQYGDETPRLVKMLDALSQLCNVSWPFWDHKETSANESISGRCYRQGRWFRHVVDLIFFWDKDPKHCEGAYLKDLERAQKYIRQHEVRDE